MEEFAQNYLVARTNRDLIDNEFKVARHEYAKSEKRLVEFFNQNNFTRIHVLKLKLTLNLSKSDNQIRPYMWKRNYTDPSIVDSSTIHGADELIEDYMTSRKKRSTLDTLRAEANANLKQATTQLCATTSQCSTHKVGQNKIVIIPNDNRVTLTKLVA
jgi:hypothetical protein